mmetsp:Transcript_22328/g.37358  ORF Transcript_22328/g.37358 Transcript_22328/m.37358 type:complete len:260 (+) Transcript_22328:67-846(+)
MSANVTWASLLTRGYGDRHSSSLNRLFVCVFLIIIHMVASEMPQTPEGESHEDSYENSHIFKHIIPRSHTSRNSVSSSASSPPRRLRGNAPVFPSSGSSDQWLAYQLRPRSPDVPEDTYVTLLRIDRDGDENVAAEFEERGQQLLSTGLRIGAVQPAVRAVVDLTNLGSSRHKGRKKTQKKNAASDKWKWTQPHSVSRSGGGGVLGISLINSGNSDTALVDTTKDLSIAGRNFETKKSKRKKNRLKNSLRGSVQENVTG